MSALSSNIFLASLANIHYMVSGFIEQYVLQMSYMCVLCTSERVEGLLNYYFSNVETGLLLCTNKFNIF